MNLYRRAPKTTPEWPWHCPDHSLVRKWNILLYTGDRVKQPDLVSKELLLRAFEPADAVDVQRLAGDERIADTTASIPHPYLDGEAERWIGSVAEETATGSKLAYAITLADTGELAGAVSLMDIEDGEAEIGYWVGVPYWGRGIATAAVQTLLDYGFGELGLRRIYAKVLSRNPASSKVLLNTGFSHTGNRPTRCGYRREEEPTDYYELLAEAL